MDEWNKAKDLYLGRLKPSTRRTYATGIAQWSSFCRHHNVEMGQAGRALVETWLLEMQESGLSDATIGTRLAAVSGFYRFCCNRYTSMVDGHEIALAHVNPADRHQVHVQKYGKSEYLTVAEVAAILQAIDKTAKNGARDYALLLGYALTGRRNSEWRCLKVEDIRLEGGIWTYRWSGKGRKNEVYELPTVVFEAVLEYTKLDGGPAAGFVFRSQIHEEKPIAAETVNNVLKRYARLARIEKSVHVHMLRHSYAMLARELGADTLTISENLAHASANTTQIYLTHLAVQRDTLSGEMVRRLGI